jgi:hypothetical protein
MEPIRVQVTAGLGRRENPGAAIVAQMEAKFFMHVGFLLFGVFLRGGVAGENRANDLGRKSYGWELASSV